MAYSVLIRRKAQKRLDRIQEQHRERIIGDGFALADDHRPRSQALGGEVVAESKDPRYEIDIFWSDEDEAYIAVVPDLPYCSAWGDTHEEALAQVKAAIRGHLKVAEKYGDPIPEPKARQTS